MRPANNSTTTTGVNGGMGHWNSPVPYLFGGLGLMLGLIAIALTILACSYRQSPSNSSSATNIDDQAAEQKSARAKQAAEMEPKIVVIMAGDDNPSYLAKPCTCAHQTHHPQVS